MITFFYLFIRLAIFKPNYGTYQFVFDKSIISSFRWFLLFFVNWPETMKDQMISWYKVSPRFLTTFSREFYAFVFNAGVLVASVFLPVVFAVKNRKFITAIRSSGGKVTFALLWFSINLLPIIFIPSHISPHQGTIALFGFLLFIMIIFDSYLSLINKYVRISLLLLIAVTWLISSYTTISLNDRIHWIKRRSDLAKTWTAEIKSSHPVLSPNSLLQIPSEDKEVIVALNDGRAFNEIYRDDSIKVIFKAVP